MEDAIYKCTVLSALICLFSSPLFGQGNTESRLAVTLPEGGSLVDAAFSNDGESVAYCVSIEGKHRIYFKVEDYVKKRAEEAARRGE